MLQFEKLTKVYKNGKKAVDHIDLTVHQGEIFGFIGPNGAGKTTTIKMITGLLTPTAGTVTIDGIRLDKDPVGAKQKFTYVPDHAQLFDGIKGIDYINFMADMYDVDVQTRQKRSEELTKAFDIEGDLNSPIRSYSHGMRQKLILCAALMPAPKLVLLDEPMVGLDPKSARELKDRMRAHAKAGGTVFFSSHALEVVENLCDRIAIIRSGRLLVTDTVPNVKKQSDTLEEVFLEMTNDA